MRASEDDGINLIVFFEQLIYAFSDEIISAFSLSFACFDYGSPQWSRLSRHLYVGKEFLNLYGVAFAFHRSLCGYKAYMP